MFGPYTTTFLLFPCIIPSLLFYVFLKSGINMSFSYQQDGPEAQRIASVIPFFPFKGVDRFYDISGLCANPAEFQLTIDIFAQRYREEDFDAIVGLDARGFILGPPVALALQKPFVMVRKAGKLPNACTGSEYSKV